MLRVFFPYALCFRAPPSRPSCHAGAMVSGRPYADGFLFTLLGSLPYAHLACAYANLAFVYAHPNLAFASAAPSSPPPRAGAGVGQGVGAETVSKEKAGSIRGETHSIRDSNMPYL